MKRIICLGLIITSLLCMSGCSGTVKQAQKLSAKEDYIMDRGPTQGGTLDMFSTKPDTLNPLLTKNIYVKDILNCVYDGLVRLNDDQLPLPSVAESWRVSNNGLIWTFQIRDNISWHDGTKLTAQDVEYTFGVISNPSANSIYRNNIKNVDKFSTEGKNIFKITLKEPNSFTAEQMIFPIIPKHYYTGDSIMKLDSKMNMNPVGSGAYKFKKSNNVEILFERNNEWWGKKILQEKDKNNMPYISKIIMKIFESEKDNVNAFLTKKVDTTSVSINESSKYSIRSDTILKKYASNEFSFLALNLNNNALRDKSIRKAMAYAIDKTKIIDDIFPGEAVAADVPVLPGSWILKETQEPFYKYDLQKSKKILQDGGWYQGKENMLKGSKKSSYSSKFTLIVNKDNTTRVMVADLIKKQLKEIGIEVEISNLSWEETLSSVKSGTYDIALMGCNIPEAFDLSYMYSSSQINNFNIAGYNNKNIDKNLKKLNFELENEMRKKIFKDIYSEIIDDEPYIGLFFSNDAIIYNKRVRGNINPTFWNKFDVQNWYIPDGLRNIKN